MWREGLFLYTATERRLPPLHTKKNNINKKSASSIQKSLKSCKLLFTLYIPAPARSGPSWHVRRLRLILHHKATQGWGVPPTPALPPPPRHPREEPGVPSSCSVRNSDACASLPVPAAGVGTDPKHALAGNPILCFSLTVSFSKPVPGRSQDAPSVPRPLSHRDAASSFLDIHTSTQIPAGWEGHSPTIPVLLLRPTGLCQMVSPPDPCFG